MTIHLLKDSGTPIERQVFTWRDMVQVPYSKLDDDAFTRVRVILMNGIESEALRFGLPAKPRHHDFQRLLPRRSNCNARDAGL